MALPPGGDRVTAYTDHPLWTPWSTYRPADLEPEGPPTVPLRLVVSA